MARPVTHSVLARLAYLAVLLIATLSGLVLDPDVAGAADRLGRALDPEIGPADAVDAARNLVLFAGWGLVWVLTAPPGRALVTVGAATVTGAGVSLSVEFLQLLSTTRTPSVLDLATNTGGALLGALMVVAVHRVVASRRRARSYLGFPAVALAVPYAGAVVGEALIPLFRQTHVAGAYGGAARRMAASASAFEWSSVLDWPWLDLPLFLPAGLLAVVALVENGVPYRRAAVSTAAAGFAAAAFLELMHGALGLRMIVGAALLHGTAIGLGALLATRIVPPFTRRFRGARRVARVGVAYAVVVLFWILRPFRPETDPRAMVAEGVRSEWWIPLQSLGSRGDLYSVMDVATSFLLYLPLGALLAVWPVRRTGPLRAFLPALYLAAGAELLQLFLADRTLDITDMLVNGGGVLVGWRLMRRAAFPVRGSLDRRGGGTEG